LDYFEVPMTFTESETSDGEVLDETSVRCGRAGGG
jgi:hypothetical protein